MNIQAPAVRHEQMRIAGMRVDTDERVDVINPYTNKVIGTRAGRASRACAGRLRQGQGLQIEADALRAAADPAADRRHSGEPQGRVRAADHRGIRAVLEGFALRSRPRLRRLFLRRPADDQGRQRGVLLRHQPAGQVAQDLHHAHAAAGHDLGDHAVQSSAQHGEPQDRAGDRHQQPHRAEADRTDAADRAGAGRRALRGGSAAGNAVGRHRQSRIRWAMP